MSSLLPKPNHWDSFPTPPQDSYEIEQFTVRTLSTLDANAFKALRLEALQNEGHLFGPRYEDEVRLSDEEWRERCRETTEKCIMGLFDNGELIGVMAAEKHKSDLSGKSVLFCRSYLKEADYLGNSYRKKGLAKQLYTARERWAVAKGYERAVFFILNDNKRSIEIHENNGANHTHTEVMEWPNRPPALWRWYEKSLKASFL